MLNETNITIDVARIFVNSQAETNNILNIIIKLGIPIISILVTGFIAYYSVKNSARNIFIQANETKMKESIAKLAEIIDRGKDYEILKFLNSSDGIYVPESIKSKIRTYAKEKIDENIKNKMLDSISKYISP